MRTDACGAVGCLCMCHSVWALVLVQASGLYVRGVNGLTPAHSWAQCSLQFGAFKVGDYGASCVQTDASDKTHHTDEAPSYVPTSLFQRERWKRAQYSSTAVTLPPNTHTYSFKSIQECTTGRQPASGKEHRPLGSSRLHDTQYQTQYKLLSASIHSELLRLWQTSKAMTNTLTLGPPIYLRASGLTGEIGQPIPTGISVGSSHLGAPTHPRGRVCVLREGQE